MSYSDVLPKFCEFWIQEYVSEGISRPVFYGDTIYKLRRVKGTANFVSKIVKRLRRRKDDPGIIERTIGLVVNLQPCMYRSFLECRTLANKAVGLYDLSKPL